MAGLIMKTNFKNISQNFITGRAALQRQRSRCVDAVLMTAVENAVNAPPTLEKPTTGQYKIRRKGQPTVTVNVGFIGSFVF